MLKKENLRKNFLRAKQIADQSLGRAEKSEVLTEDLNDIDRRVEIIKNVSTATGKKLRMCMQGDGTDMDKRLKKIPITALATSMSESAESLGTNLIGQMYKMCGCLEAELGKEILQHELELEEGVLDPLTEIIDVDIANVMKTRKTLNRLVLDMDSAKNRYQTAARQTQAPAQAGGSRADNIKEEYEDAHMKVEQCRDQLITEMFTFLSKESEYAKCLVELVRAQSCYHKRSLEKLEKVLPELETMLDTYQHKPVYGQPLETHLNLSKREIACVIEECVCELLECGLEEEGLFRVAGSNSRVKKLKAAFDAGLADVDEFNKDPHVIAGALKMYLRELPEPLLTYGLYTEWMQAAHRQPDDRLQALWLAVNKLPKANYTNLRYLIKFLAKLAEKSDVNKMSPSNIAIVMGPNLIWSPADGGPNVLTTGTQSAIVESFISHCDWFFPGEIDFHQSGQSMQASAEMTQSMSSAHAPTTLSAPVRSPSESAALGASFASLDGHSDPKLSPQVQRRQIKKAAPAPPGPRPEKCATMPRSLDPADLMTLSVTEADRTQSLPVFSGDDGSVTPTPSSPVSPVEKRSLPRNPVERRLTTRPHRPSPPPPPPPGAPVSPTAGAAHEQTKM